jgi:hypothetical protein
LPANMVHPCTEDAGLQLPAHTDLIGSHRTRWDDEEIQATLLAVSLAPKLRQLSIHMRRNTGIQSRTLVGLASAKLCIGSQAPGTRARWLCCEQRGCQNNTDVLALCPQAHVQLFTGLTSLTCDGIYAPVYETHLVQLFEGLPALESCSLHFDCNDTMAWGKAGFPQTLLCCTRLTSLQVSVPIDTTKNVLDWGGLPDGITALQHLAQLRLQNCLSRPLTEVNSIGVSQLQLRSPMLPAVSNEGCNFFSSAVSAHRMCLRLQAITALSGLTNLGLCCYNERFYESMMSGPLAPALAMVTSLRCVDLTGWRVPTALSALRGEDAPPRSRSGFIV